MNKSTHNFGNSVLGQLISLIPTFIIDSAVKSHNSDRYIKRFTTLEHLVTMLFCVGSNSTSLREVCTNLLGLEGKLKHIKLKRPPKKRVHLVMLISTEVPLYLNKSIMIY